MYKDTVSQVPNNVLQNPLCPTPESIARNLIMIAVMHYDFSGDVKQGRIIVNQSVSDDVRLFFKIAFEMKFPIHSVIPVSEFDWDDSASCAANNSSGHNMRFISGTTRLSSHARGLAMDINPRQNPCYNLDPETLALQNIVPPDGIYIPGTPGTLQKGHHLILLMIELGWIWGGGWTFPQDYQHLQKVL